MQYVNLATNMVPVASTASSACGYVINETQNRNPKFFSTIEKTNCVFNAVDWVIATAEMCALIDRVSNRAPIIPTILEGVQTDLGALVGIGIMCGYIVWGTLIHSVVKKCNRLVWKVEDSNKLLNEIAEDYPSIKDKVNVDFVLPPKQVLRQVFITSRIVINIALLCLTKFSVCYLLSATLLTMSLVRITQRQWLKLDIKENFYDTVSSLLPTTRKINLSYYLYLPTYKGPKKADEKIQDCAVCLDEKPDTLFCNTHAFHNSCLIGHFYGQSSNILNNAAITLLTTQSGIPSRWSIVGKKDDLPNCPNCRQLPLSYDVSASVDHPQASSVELTFN